MAYIGHQIIGDGKYGQNQVNKKFNKNKQLLIAYKYIFKFDQNSKLSYLNNKTVSIDDGNLKSFLNT